MALGTAYIQGTERYHDIHQGHLEQRETSGSRYRQWNPSTVLGPVDKNTVVKIPRSYPSFSVGILCSRALELSQVYSNMGNNKLLKQDSPITFEPLWSIFGKTGLFRKLTFYYVQLWERDIIRVQFQRFSPYSSGLDEGNNHLTLQGSGFRFIHTPHSLAPGTTVQSWQDSVTGQRTNLGSLLQHTALLLNISHNF